MHCGPVDRLCSIPRVWRRGRRPVRGSPALWIVHAGNLTGRRSARFRDFHPRKQCGAHPFFAAAGLLVSECRSAWAGAVVALATLAACWLLTGKRHDATRSGSARIAIAPALLVLSSVGFLFAIWPHATILDRAATVATPATYSAGGAESSSGTKCCSQRSVGGDSSWHGRKLAWAGAMRMIRQEPWTGNGLGSYPVLQSRYAGVGLDIGPLRIRPSLANQAHSLYLQMAAEIGIPGLLIFLAIPVTI